MQIEDGAAWVEGTKARLRIVPLNWRPAEWSITVDGIDDHLRPVNLLRLVATPATFHRLVTAVEVVPASGSPRWRFEGTTAIAGDLHIAYDPANLLVNIDNKAIAVR